MKGGDSISPKARSAPQDDSPIVMVIGPGFKGSGQELKAQGQALTTDQVRSYFKGQALAAKDFVAGIEHFRSVFGVTADGKMLMSSHVAFNDIAEALTSWDDHVRHVAGIDRTRLYYATRTTVPNQVHAAYLSLVERIQAIKSHAGLEARPREALPDPRPHDIIAAEELPGSRIYVCTNPRALAGLRQDTLGAIDHEARRIIESCERRQGNTLDGHADVEGLPAEIAAILTRGDFPTLADDEYAKVGAWLTANARKHYDGMDPTDLAKTRRMEEAKKRLRVVLEYNTALRKAAAPAVAPAATQAPAGQSPPAGEPAGQEDAQASPLPDRAKTAYDQYLRAVPGCTGKDGRAPIDQQCYDWLKAHNDGDTLPAFDTWQRYVRQARRHLGEQKNAPRAGRSFGRSIVPAKDIEPPEAEEAD